MALKGHLQHFGLGELFQTLACNQHTGTLYVTSRHEKKTIYFATGSIAFLGSGSGTILLGEVLLRAGVVSREQIEAAVEEQKNSDKLFGRILIEQGVIEPEHLQAALRTKFEEELYELLMWEEGDFEFVPDFCPPDLLEPMQKYTQVRVDPQSVLIEGLRQLDESRIIRTRLPDPKIWVARQVEAIPAGAEISDRDREIWGYCAQSAPVEQIQRVAPTSRFQTLKILYRFVEEGWLRTLDFTEMLEVARQHRKHNERDRAADLYRFLQEWGIPQSRDASFLVEVGRYMVEVGRKKDASAILFQALERLRLESRMAEAWEIGRVLRDLHPNDLAVLQQLWTLRSAASPRSLEELRVELLNALKRQGEFHEAEALLAELEESERGKFQYWVERGELAQKIGQIGLAVDYLERALRLAEETKSRPESIRAARLLFEIDPEITGLRNKLESLIHREEGVQKFRRIRRIVLTVATVLIVAAAIPALRYETRARGLFQESLRLQIAEAETVQLEEARAHLREIVADYGMSTVASRSRDALQDLDARIVRLRQEDKARVEDLEQRDRQSRERRRQHAEELLTSSRTAENEGRFKEARASLDRLLEGPVRSLPLEVQAEIRLPLSIETDPPGARIDVAGVGIGRTPYVHHFEPGSEPFVIRLSRPGCEDQELKHTDDGRARLRIQMTRAPLAAGALPGGLDRAATSIPGFILVPCRDGRVYALPDSREATKTARRVFIGGKPGHPSARVVAEEDVIVIAGYDGEIHCVETTGWETRWGVRLDSPVLAVSSIPGGDMAIGDETGRVQLLDRNTGRVIARSEPGFPVKSLAVRGDVLVVTDGADRVRILELPGLALLHERAYPSEISAVLSDGSLLLRNGTRQAPEGVEQWPAPATDVVERDGTLFYGTTDRRWVEFDGSKWTAFPAPTILSCPPLTTGEETFFGGRDGRLYCVSPTGDPQWSIQVSAPVVGLASTADGDVLVLLVTGQLLLFEGRVR